MARTDDWYIVDKLTPEAARARLQAETTRIEAAYARWLYREVEKLDRTQLLDLRAAIETMLANRSR